jgi:glyoxylase-like metal-dependent hydrolase (beta-lactamase superfamily II)
MERLAPDLYRLAGSRTVGVHLVMADVPTLIDAGSRGGAASIERQLRAAGVAPRRILFTHGDPDHVGGSDRLRAAFDAEVLAPIGERPFLDRTGWPELPRRRRTLMRLFFHGAPAPVVDGWFEPGTAPGGIPAIAAPGHTPGHVVFEWDGWLLAGDAFVSGGRFRESPGIFTLDRPLARRTIEDLAARGARAASSSHGRPAPDAAAKLESLIATWR